MILSHPAAPLKVCWGSVVESHWRNTEIFWENSKKQEPRQKSAFDLIAV